MPSRSLRTVGFALGAVHALASLAAAQATELVTLGAGGQSDVGSLYPEISADGRWITFQSGATNLVPGDTNGAPDIYLKDMQTGAMIRASVGHLGQEGAGDSLDPALSLDGQVVAWFSYAGNLVADDTNGQADVFVRDVAAGTTVRASVATGGGQASGASRYPSLSHDGRYVAFESTAANLVPGDTNGVRDVFVHDLLTGVTTRASVSASGAQADGESLDSTLSEDGRFVAFESAASNLVPGDTNGTWDVFVKDLVTGEVVRASVAWDGAQGDGPSGDPSLSGDGTRVSFSSDAPNLVPSDANGYVDVFLRDLAAGTTERVNVSSAGTQGHLGAYDGALSADGESVAFFSRASNLVPGDTNSALDVFVRSLSLGKTDRVSIGSLMQQGDGDCFYPAITPGGRYVAFDSFSANLVVGDENGTRDIFLHDRWSPFRPYCAGDGSIPASCPCGNGALPGRGCDNSAATGGATLVASGDPEADGVRLDAAGMPPASVAVFLQSRESLGAGEVFGDGVRCLAGGTTKLYVKLADGGAAWAPGPHDPTLGARSAAHGDPLAPGDTRYYQVWYRDPAAGFCPPSGYNLTNGVRIQH